MLALSCVSHLHLANKWAEDFVLKDIFLIVHQICQKSELSRRRARCLLIIDDMVKIGDQGNEFIC